MKKERITADLLKNLCSGSHEAYREVYLAYKESVERFLLKLTRSEEIAQELTQEIFVAIWEKRSKIEPDKSFKSYLFSIAKNTAINYFDHEKVKERYETEQASNPDKFTYYSEDYVIAHETEHLIDVTIEHMPKQRQRIFNMSYKEGMSNDTIAQKLQMNKMTVANHLTNARKEIKGLLMMAILAFGC